MSSRKGKSSVKPATARANVSGSDESSGSSPQRKSSRLSSQSLLKQATMANFLKNPVRESPRTLFKGLSKKSSENSLAVVQTDETMILTPLPVPTQQPLVLEKSRAKRKSIHEESFLHPSQKALVQSPVAKKKSSSSSVASSVFSTEDLRGDDIKKYFRHPKSVGRFAAKRKTKESIEAEMCVKRSPIVKLVPVDRAPVVEEASDLEFTVNSSEDHIDIAGSRANVLSDNTKVYENLPGNGMEMEGTDLDTGGSARDPDYGENMSATSSRLHSRRTNQMSETQSESLLSGKRASKSQSRKSGSSADGERSSSYGVDFLPQAEPTTSGNSSARVSKRLSSRQSISANQGNTSDGESFRDSHRSSASQTQPHKRQSSVKKGAPPSTQTLSRGSLSQSQETDPQLEASASGSTPTRSSISKTRLGSMTPAGSQSLGEKNRALSGVSQDATESSAVSQMSRRRLELSQKSAGSPRRMSSRSKPSVYRRSVPVTEAGEVENNETEPVLLLANSSDDEDMEETSRVNHLKGSTPHLPYTPKLPRKNVTPKSDWRSRARTVVDTQASDRPGVAARGARGKAARPKPRAVVNPSIPRKLTHSLFKFFAGGKVSSEALEEVDQVAEEFWDNVVEDLKVYATHAGRNTIEKSDVELLMRRQRFVTDKIPLDSLIEKYMVLEDQEKLILVARSGNRLV